MRRTANLRRSCIAAAAVSLTTFQLGIAHAQQAEAPKSTTAPSHVKTDTTQPASPEKMAEARERFKRGLQLFDEKNFEAARVELERAYELAPSWKLLYNIGLCYAQRGDYVEAIKDLERYVKEGGDRLPEGRADEVAKELTNLRPRIAYVTVHTNVPDAELQLDDEPIGKVPNEPVMVNPGKRKFGVSKAGYFSSIKVVTPATSERLTVEIDLKEMPKATPVDPTFRNYALIAWGGTAALLAGGIVTGVAATTLSSNLKTNAGQINPDPDTLSSESRRMKTFAVVSDICFGGALIGAGFATYFTIKAGQASSGGESPPAPPNTVGSLKFDIGLTGAMLSGKF